MWSQYHIIIWLISRKSVFVRNTSDNISNGYNVVFLIMWIPKLIPKYYLYII